VTSMTPLVTPEPSPKDQMSTGIVRDATICATRQDSNREGVLYQSSIITGMGVMRDSMNMPGPELGTSTKSSHPKEVGGGLPDGGCAGGGGAVLSTLVSLRPSGSLGGPTPLVGLASGPTSRVCSPCTVTNPPFGGTVLGKSASHSVMYTKPRCGWRRGRRDGRSACSDSSGDNVQSSENPRVRTSADSVLPSSPACPQTAQCGLSAFLHLVEQKRGVPHPRTPDKSRHKSVMAHHTPRWDA
jgi:hypothetical protein